MTEHATTSGRPIPGPSTGLRHSPLHQEHLDLGARMIETEGWSMPVEFSGVFQEYRAHRRRSVVWDASNLGSVRVSGPGAAELVGRTFTNDLRRCRPGRSQYTLLLSEADAGILDDLVVWWVDPEMLVLTPSRPERVLDALRSVRDTGLRAPCTVEETTSNRVLLAVQGAQAGERIAEIAPAAASMPARGVQRCQAGGLVAITSFGRQIGFELHLHPAAGRDIYRRLVAAGATPAGLGMRETLRFESGVPRYGVELSPDVTPLDAGFTRAVGFDSDFLGRSALTEQRQRGAERILRMVLTTGRRIPPAGSELLLNDRSVGRITSGNFSPHLHRGIAFALVRTDVGLGSRVTVLTTEGTLDAEVSAIPPNLEAH